MSDADLTRREFIAKTAVAGAGIVALGVGCGKRDAPGPAAQPLTPPSAGKSRVVRVRNEALASSTSGRMARSSTRRTPSRWIRWGW